MSKNKVLSLPARDSTEWNNAWATVSRLAAARQTALNDMKRDHPVPSVLHPKTDRPSNVDSAAGTLTRINSTDEGQIERAIAEIEQACAALKNAEPALELWVPDTALVSEPRKQHSVWILIGTIWLSMLLVVAGAIGAIAYFLD
jgi:hypothetical protein